jgi:hypothetical protein
LLRNLERKKLCHGGEDAKKETMVARLFVWVSNLRLELLISSSQINLSFHIERNTLLSLPTICHHAITLSSIFHRHKIHKSNNASNNYFFLSSQSSLSKQRVNNFCSVTLRCQIKLQCGIYNVSTHKPISLCLSVSPPLTASHSY